MNHLVPTREEFSALNANTLGLSVHLPAVSYQSALPLSQVPQLIPLFIYFDALVKIVGAGFRFRDKERLDAFGADRDDIVLILQDSFYR